MSNSVGPECVDTDTHTHAQIRKPQIGSSNGTTWKTSFRTIKYILLPGNSNDFYVNFFLDGMSLWLLYTQGLIEVFKVI